MTKDPGYNRDVAAVLGNEQVGNEHACGMPVLKKPRRSSSRGERAPPRKEGRKEGMSCKTCKVCNCCSHCYHSDTDVDCLDLHYAKLRVNDR